MTELEQMTDSLFSAFKGYVEQCTQPLLLKVAELETRLANMPIPINGKDGENGKDADGQAILAAVAGLIETMPQCIREFIQNEFLKLPVPQDGEKGDRGDAGDNGKDAESVDYERIESRIKELMPIAINGDKGEAGMNGKDADPVDYELIRKMIPEPVHGKDGKSIKGDPGENGTNGTNGEDGRDALEIDPLSSIDVTRSYARRTYAIHKGGLWIARRSMPGIDSWECVVDGVDVDATRVDVSEDYRTLTFRFFSSGGKEFHTVKDVPSMIWRGTYKSGNEYLRGDAVTWDGSTYHCEVKTTNAPGTDDWKLIAKRGRDGKDATMHQSKAMEPVRLR